MITKVFFKDFKSFENAELQLLPFTTLVGTNASGKTNGIEGIKLLSEIATGRDLSIILDGSKNMDSGIRGGSKGCCRFKASAFQLGCEILCKDGAHLRYHIKISVSSRILVQEESLKKVDGNYLIFRTKAPDAGSGDIKVEYKNGKRGTNPDLMCIRTSSILAQMQTKMPHDGEVLANHLKYIDELLAELKSMLFLEPVPSEMRDYWRATDSDLRRNCENISSAVKALCSDRDQKDALLNAVRLLPENEIEDIAFVETTLGDVIFTLRERYGHHSDIIDAKRLSDGTLRCVAVMTAILTVPQNSYLIIEEVDNGIHPGRARGLIQTLCDIAEKRKVTMIITTHNAALLNCLTSSKLEGVTVTYRDTETGASRFVLLTDIPDFFKLMAKGRLGDIVTDDSLLKSIKSSQLNKPNDYSWMEGLL